MSEGGRRRRLVLDEDISGVTVVSFADRKILDEAVIQQLGEEFKKLADGPRKIVLNFGNVEYMSSAALGKLIAFRNDLKAKKGQVRLCRVHPQIYDVFKITRLNRVFDMFEDEPAALEGF